MFTRSHRTLGAVGCLAVTLAVAGGDCAQAHEVRFIASYGNNANLCTRDAPCKKLQKGVSRTPDGGELIILDSGDFGGGATIGKSITISAVGVSATIGKSITIDNADATVVLRRLRLNDFDDHGILAIAADARLFVSGSASRNNGISGLVFVTGPGLIIDSSRFENNGNHGVYVDRVVAATITRSVASGNNLHGIVLLQSSTNVTWTTAEHNGDTGYYVSSSRMTLEQSVARGNGVGLSATLSTAAVSNSVLTNNNVGLLRHGTATILTRENNIISGNGTNVEGTLTPLGRT